VGAVRRGPRYGGAGRLQLFWLVRPAPTGHVRRAGRVTAPTAATTDATAEATLRDPDPPAATWTHPLPRRGGAPL
jgi:hypothetical protein